MTCLDMKSNLGVIKAQLGVCLSLRHRIIEKTSSRKCCLNENRKNDEKYSRKKFKKKGIEYVKV
jgi:hypothetical protein